MAKDKVDFHEIFLKDVKNWGVDIEKQITEKWKKQELYSFNKKAKKIYSIDTPPPMLTPLFILHRR